MVGGTAIYLFYPETQGLSLEAVDMIFTESQSIWDPVRVAKGLPDMVEYLQEEGL